MPQAIPHVAHIGIFTNQPQALINFYTKKLGFKIISHSPITKNIIRKIFKVNCDCVLSKLVCGEAALEIFSSHSKIFKKNKEEQSGYNHWSFIVEDKTRFCEKLSQKKVKIIKVARNGYYTYFVRDPDGNRIEIQDYLYKK